MIQRPLPVRHLPETFVPDQRRVIPRFFAPSDESRLRALIARVTRMEEGVAAGLLNETLDAFGSRHKNIRAVFTDHFTRVAHLLPHDVTVSSDRCMLIGAYLTMEYAVEAAALFNPSIVEAPNQAGLPAGTRRFLMSLRAVGEGHISSIVFRRGVIDTSGQITLEPPSPYTCQLKVKEDRFYHRNLFRRKLDEMGGLNEHVDAVLERLGDRFSLRDLIDGIEGMRPRPEGRAFHETTANMVWLARSNYHLEVPDGTDPSEIVIFPTSDNESRGIEDARLVRFVDDDGTVCYFGTYTAYNGFRILPQLFETSDFRTIKIHTLNGNCVQNKGLALFPRRIGGRYMMISRQDGENLYLSQSDNIRFWNEARIVQRPRHPWEFVQIGNCGSPMETDAGWLLLTHGVGPMRQYCIGATLLDRNDPARFLGQLEEPMIVPAADRRDGYVPNVVYTCGAMIHGEHVVIPYAMNDTETCIATVPVRDLLNRITRTSTERPQRPPA